MKLSQIFLIVILSFIVAFATAEFVKATDWGFATQNSADATSMRETAYQRVVRTGILRCGYAISPPRLVKDPNTGKVSGLDYDIWQAIGQKLGLKIEWTEEAGWGDFIQGLSNQRYDAFCAEMWPDDARSKYLSLTMPFLYSFVQTYVRADDHRFDGDIEKLNAPDVTLPAIDGDVSSVAFKNRFPRAQLLSLPQMATISDMFSAVTSKKADAMFFDQGMFAGLDKSNPGQLRLLENVPPAFTYGSYFGFNIKETALRDMVNIALRSLIDDGSMEKMASSYSTSYKVARKNFE